MSGSEVKNYRFNKKKNILLLSYSFSNTLIDPPNGSLNGDIINQKNLISLFSFLNDTSKELFSKIYIRNQNTNISSNFSDSLIKHYPLIKFEKKNKSFLEIIDNYNFFIHIYFGTTFFELMALNKPSIIIYNEDTHPPFDKNFKSYIKKFKKNNILFENQKLAVKFLNKNYFDLENWWNDRNTKN